MQRKIDWIVMRCMYAALIAFSLAHITACSPERSKGEFPRVHQVAGGQSEVFANAYIIEGEESLVVVDALLTRPASQELRRRVDAFGKPLLAVVLTHGHPDHYGGVARLVEGLPHVRVIALEGVDAVIRRDDAMKGERLAEFDIDWAPVRTFPNTIAVPSVPLDFGEFALTPFDFGEGESHHDSVWVLRGPTGEFVFTGDLVMSGAHAFTADAHTGAWLESLARLAAMFGADTWFYPGHGAPGDSRLLAAQREYIETFRAEIADLAEGRAELGAAETLELERRMVCFARHERMSRWIHEGADPVAAELARAPNR